MRLDRLTGLVFIALALVVLGIWVPHDTGSGLIEYVRNSAVIGDALGPSVAGMFILLGGFLTLLAPRSEGKLRRADIVWAFRIVVVLIVSLFAMRHAGVWFATFSGHG